jgi:hypothetical protein
MGTLTDRLKQATRPEMVEVAPGKFAPKDPSIPLPEYTISKWERNGDGTWRVVPFKEPFVRLDVCLAALLGFPGRQCNTIRRLGEAGFVEMIRIAPGTTLLNLDSWFNHLRRCAEDPEFWQRQGGNFRAYRESI